jgi:hypothetical protein
MENPIPRGGAVDGWIQYVIPNLSDDQLTGSIIKLQFVDINETSFYATRTMNNIGSPNGVYSPSVGVSKDK